MNMNDTSIALCQFAKDVDEGLSSNPKKLSSKYFYDDHGSRIFQEIMEMPEYYPTNAELEILTNQAGDIFEATEFYEGFNIVELGAGDGTKTKAFLSHLVEKGIDVTYHPLDISQEAMTALESDLKQSLPSLKIQSLVGDYFKVLNEFNFGDRPNLFLFLGGNIGNYEPKEATNLLQLFGQHMKKGDQFLIGIDLKKNPRKIQVAYDDPQGITRRFNLNLLRRINRELGANFDLEQFSFYSTYEPQSGDVRSYLFSLSEQDVKIEAIGKTIHFKKDEIICTELSKKYSLSEIQELAHSAGFVHQTEFYDSQRLFVDSLWEKV